MYSFRDIENNVDNYKIESAFIRHIHQQNTKPKQPVPVPVPVPVPILKQIHEEIRRPRPPNHPVFCEVKAMDTKENRNGLTVDKLQHVHLPSPTSLLLSVARLPIFIHILCHNEEDMIPLTVAHYRRYLPTATITIWDNESSDQSVSIARRLGCHIRTWKSNHDQIDDNKYVRIKGDVVQEHEWGWVFSIDMDEWACITEDDLANEVAIRNTHAIQFVGVQMAGDSNHPQLKDKSPNDFTTQLNRGHYHHFESKVLAVRRPEIQRIVYVPGAHDCQLFSNTSKLNTFKEFCNTSYNNIATDDVPHRSFIHVSQHTYLNKHACQLGLPYFTKKQTARYQRSEQMRKKGWAKHYERDPKEWYNQTLHFANEFVKHAS